MASFVLFLIAPTHFWGNLEEGGTCCPHHPGKKPGSYFKKELSPDLQTSIRAGLWPGSTYHLSKLLGFLSLRLNLIGYVLGT